MTSYPYESNKNLNTVVTFEVNPNLQVAIRQGYDLLDWFSELGGTLWLFQVIGSIIVGLINRNLL